MRSPSSRPVSRAPHRRRSERDWRRTRSPSGALAEGRSALVWRRQVADTDTPISAALKLIEPGRGDFLLESVEGGAIRGRHTLLGLAPDLVFRADGDRPEINRAWRTDRSAFQPGLGGTTAALNALVAECRADVPDELPDALSCLVGFFGYETVGLVETLPRPLANPIGTPDMLFVRPTIILVFDRLTDDLFLVAPVWASSHAPDAALAEAVALIEGVAGCLAAPIPRDRQAALVPLPETLDPQPVIDGGAYRSMVERGKDYIAAGDIFQVVLAQRFTAPFPLPPFDLYRALRRINPSPFLYFLDFPGFSLIGSSPEILVRVRDDEVTIRPIAGTRPRGRDAGEDAANRRDLLADPKERAEHLMLLDLGRNDVGRVAQAGSVRVTESYTVEYYSHVMHIVSNVVGRLDQKHNALDALFAGFPAGTVSGAPKVRACQIIAELEPETRGAYAGGVGYFSPRGAMDSCLVLRTAVVKDGVMHVQAGAGIVADSDPAAEQRECEAKADALIAAAREALARAREGGYGQ